MSLDSGPEGKSLVLTEHMKAAMSTLWQYLNIHDEPRKSDVIFVLGSGRTGPAEKAAKLYKAGFSSKIAFISKGGTFSQKETAEWGMPEHEKYEEVLLGAGIPKDAIVSEGMTSNTVAEAKAAVPFLGGKGIDPKTIILVSRPVHQRRAFATFQKQHPDIRYINCPSDEPLVFGDPEIQDRLVQEAERLLDYSKKGDLEQQSIPRDTLIVAAVIRKELRRVGRYTTRIKQVQ